MTTVLCVGTYGALHPTRATLPFVSALVAANAGQEAQIALMGDATCLMKDSVAAQVHADEWPPLSELLGKVVAQEIPVFV